MRPWPLLLLAACAHRPMDVSLRAAVVGPADWDGLGAAAPVVQEALIDRFAALDPLTAAAGAAVVGDLARSMAPPDVRGTMRLSVGGASGGAQVTLHTISDSFTPVWRGATLRGVPLRKDTAVLVELWDNDPLNDDDLVGQVSLDARTLRAAARAGAPRWVDTTELTGGQLLRVAVEVVPAE